MSRTFLYENFREAKICLNNKGCFCANKICKNEACPLNHWWSLQEVKVVSDE